MAKTATTITHTMVIAFRVVFYYHLQSMFRSEEAAFPLQGVADTSAETLGRTLLNALERFILGVTYAEYLHMMSIVLCVHFLVVAVAADAASANKVANKKIEAHTLSLSDGDLIHGAMYTIFLYERCALHQLARTLVTLFSRQRVNKKFRAVFKMFRSRKVKRNVVEVHEKVLRRQIADNFNGPPCDSPADKKLREALEDLLMKRSTAELYGRDMGAPEAYSAEEVAKLDLQAWLEFLEHANLSGPAAHIDPTATLESVQDKGVKLCHRVLFGVAVPEYLEQRWLKQRPFLQWLGKYLLLSTAGLETFKEADLLKGLSKKSKEHMAKFIQLVIQFVNDPKSRYTVAFLLFSINALDRLAYVLFFAADFTHTSDGQRVWRGEGPAPTDRASSMSLIVDETFMAMGRIWEFYLDPEGTAKSSLAAGADPFWPAGEDEHDKAIVAMDCVFTLLTELQHRFGFRFEMGYPYKWSHLDDPKLCHDVEEPARSEAAKQKHQAAMEQFLDDEDACEIVELRNFKKMIEDERVPGPKLAKFQGGRIMISKTQRAVSLKEENLHAEGRAHIMHGDGKPTSLARKAVIHHRDCVRRNWRGRGGRDLARAPARVRRAFKAICARRKGRTTVHGKFARRFANGSVALAWAWEQMTVEDACVVCGAHARIEAPSTPNVFAYVCTMCRAKMRPFQQAAGAVSRNDISHSNAGGSACILFGCYVVELVELRVEEASRDSSLRPCAAKVANF